MKRLNPLYLLSLFFTIVFLSFYLLQNKKNDYLEKIQEISNLQIKAKEYKDLSESWKNESFINKTLDEILKSSSFKNENITKTATKESIKIKLESSNSTILDNFLNKILNKPLIIKKLELQKSSITLEIGIK